MNQYQLQSQSSNNNNNNNNQQRHHHQQQHQPYHLSSITTDNRGLSDHSSSNSSPSTTSSSSSSSGTATTTGSSSIPIIISPSPNQSQSQSQSHPQKRLLTSSRLEISCSPAAKKRRTKSGNTHSKLIIEFAQRSHVRNSVNLASYHGKKQNIKTLCPYHDMLPVINSMEKEVFNNRKENNIKKEYCNILPIIRNHCEWCCSGSPYKLECRNLLMKAKELYEYSFNYNDIALPFMNAVVLGGPNPNICIKLLERNDPGSGSGASGVDIQFKPLQNLSLLERNDTCNIALKAISCGTFKRNLQPVPDACRITKLLDGDGCFVTVKECNISSLNNIYFKVSTNEVRQRRKLQGTDSVLGVGFDCASRLSWQKPRIYWMHQSIHILRDKKSKKITQKKHISNRDLRFSLLLPYQFKGSIIVYMIGIQQDKSYKVNTNVASQKYNSNSNNNNDDNMNGLSNYTQNNKQKNDDNDNKTNAQQIPPPCFTNNNNNDIDLSTDNNSNQFILNTNNLEINNYHPPSITNANVNGIGGNSPLSNSGSTASNITIPLPNVSAAASTIPIPLKITSNINNNQQQQQQYIFPPSIATTTNNNNNSVIYGDYNNNYIKPPTFNINNNNNDDILSQSHSQQTFIPTAPPLTSFASSSNSNSTIISAHNGNIRDESFINNGVNNAKFIDIDLEAGNKNYIDLLQSVNFSDENCQTYASKWIKICIEKYSENEDIYHNYLLNIISCLINTISSEKTFRGLKRTWMMHNNCDNEWSFLHMIAENNLLYLYQSIINLLSKYKHQIITSMTTTSKDSKLKISPLYASIINNYPQFTQYLCEYYCINLSSLDLMNILQNGAPTTSNNNSNNKKTLIDYLIMHNHTNVLHLLINTNNQRQQKFLYPSQIQLIMNKLNINNNNNNAFTK